MTLFNSSMFCFLPAEMKTQCVSFNFAIQVFYDFFYFGNYGDREVVVVGGGALKLRAVGDGPKNWNFSKLLDGGGVVLFDKAGVVVGVGNKDNACDVEAIGV